MMLRDHHRFPKLLRAIVLVLIAAGVLMPLRVDAASTDAAPARLDASVQPTVSVAASYEVFTLTPSPICLHFNSDNTIAAYLLSAPLQPLLGTYFGDPASVASFSGTGGAIGSASGVALPGFALVQLRVGFISTLAIGFPASC